jgi:cytochrome c oxidase assembly protein subunit 15
MPFDATMSERSALNRSRPVGVWLLVMCGMIGVMIVLGGVTRLTGSGLSIMEWAPVSGVLPPLSEAEWRRLYGLYQTIPQYALVNDGFGLEGFKRIFWLEWAHRLWGRLIGLAFLGPLVWFAWRGMISRGLVVRLAGLFVLGGLQGAVGWFMVASGFFEGSTAVSAYRLVVHLTLALGLYAAILWTGLGVLRPVPVGRVRAGEVWLVRVAAGLAAVTIVAGGFVAGNHAGLTYNTFPLMDGRVVPEGYAALQPFWRNWFENVAAVQFDHRALATVTALTVFAAVAAGFQGVARGPLLVLGGFVVLQYGLGVATLLHVVPVGLAALHQAEAVLVLTAVLVALHRLRRA